MFSYDLEARGYLLALSSIFKGLYAPVRPHQRFIVMGLIATTLLLSVVGLIKTDLSLNDYPTIFLASLLGTLWIIFGLYSLAAFLPAKLTQEACFDWFISKYFSSRKSDDDSKPIPSETTSFFWAGSFIIGLLFYALIVIPIAVLLLLLPSLLDALGLVNAKAVEYVLSEVIFGGT